MNHTALLVAAGLAAAAIPLAPTVAAPPPVFAQPFGIYPYGPIITLNGRHRR